MAKQQKKAGGKAKDKARKLALKKRTIRELEPRAGRDVTGGATVDYYRHKK
jgi:hypothetical protein